MRCDSDLTLLAELDCEGPERTEAIGAWLGTRLGPGAGVALYGELGSGKTTLVRGIARGLGIEHPEEVCSPTYLTMVEYEGPVPLLHIDGYFAERASDLEVDGGAAGFQDRGVVCVEWAERLPLPASGAWLHVEIEHAGGQRRRLRWFGGPEWSWVSGLEAGAESVPLDGTSDSGTMDPDAAARSE